MKFLVDESVEYRIVIFLRELGFDALSVAEDFPTTADNQILTRAFREDRIVLTNDRDFGELIYRHQLPHKGVIFFRLRDEVASSKIERLKNLFSQHRTKLPGRFVVVTDHKIRFKKTSES